MWLCWVVTTSRITISCDNPPPVSWVSLFSCCLCSAGAEWRVVSWMSCTWARCTLSINTSLVPQPICLGKIPLPPPSRPGNSCGSFSRADLSLPQLTYFPLCKFFFFFCCLPSLNRAVTQCTYSPQHPTVNFDIILIMIKSCAQTQTDDECIPLTNTLCAYINCAAELSCFSKTIKTTSVAASPQKNDCTGWLWNACLHSMLEMRSLQRTRTVSG